MKVFSVSNFEVDSTWLQKAILGLFFEGTIFDCSPDITELVINAEEDWNVGQLAIRDYPNLLTIQLDDQSFESVRSLRIFNNPQLKTITIGDVCCNRAEFLSISSILSII